MKKLTPEEIDKILEESGVNKKEFIENVNMSECRNYCRNLNRIYMFSIGDKTKNNPDLKLALDSIFENTEFMLKCPRCGEIIYRR